MRFYPFFTEQFLSPLTPAEVLRCVRNSTLTTPNDSWRDTFEVNPVQPFQGVIGADSFLIERIIILRIRRAQPPPIRGHVKAVVGSQGSTLCLEYRPQLMASVVVAGALVLAAIMAGIIGIAKEWLSTGANSLLCLFYFIPPTVAWFSLLIQLKEEANRSRSFLTELLEMRPRAASAT
ncbi:hypothetical protein [Hymenobacter sp. PAMC 26628]|uniref:hypothetical protein n=1 Tax=Hymenobacter sp. PAMC 26628 TaxID=1484118 RepID=UPI0012FFB441|nr:hypothetical protein [Hymenobacter sp. PAMC 26628]